jgi:hypothetical protein
MERATPPKLIKTNHAAHAVRMRNMWSPVDPLLRRLVTDGLIGSGRPTAVVDCCITKGPY